MRGWRSSPLSWRRIDAGRARRAIVALLCVFAALAPGAVARGESRPGVVELPLPRKPAPGEDVWLQLRVGPLPRGTEIRVSTADGVLVGTASPFGAPRSQSTATYTIPLPKTAIRGGERQVAPRCRSGGSAEPRGPAGRSRGKPPFRAGRQIALSRLRG